MKANEAEIAAKAGICGMIASLVVYFVLLVIGNYMQHHAAVQGVDLAALF